MKLVRLVSTLAGTLVLSLLFGTTALIYAQDQRDEAKTPPQETRPEASKPAQDEPSSRQGEAKPAEQSEDKPARSENKPAKQENAKPSKQPGEAGQSTQHAQRSAEHRGGHIPDDKFRAQFGRQHTFKINRTTTAQGQPGFQYGGYTFVIVDAWPAEWAYTDDCYVDYVDGEYFLFDLLHQGHSAPSRAPRQCGRIRLCTCPLMGTLRCHDRMSCESGKNPAQPCNLLQQLSFVCR